MSKNTTENVNKKRLWTQEENAQLMKAAKNKANVPLSQVFNEFAAKYNRPVGSVTQHYYQMVKENTEQPAQKPVQMKNPTPEKTQPKNKTQQNNDITILVKKIKKMPARAISSLSYIVNNMQV